MCVPHVSTDYHLYGMAQTVSPSLSIHGGFGFLFKVEEEEEEVEEGGAAHPVGRKARM